MNLRLKSPTQVHTKTFQKGWLSSVWAAPLVETLTFRLQSHSWLNLQWNLPGKLQWAEEVSANTDLGVKGHFCLAGQCSLECVCVCVWMCVYGGPDSLFTAWLQAWPQRVGKYDDNKSIVEERCSALTERGALKALGWKWRSPSRHPSIRPPSLRWTGAWTHKPNKWTRPSKTLTNHTLIMHKELHSYLYSVRCLTGTTEPAAIIPFMLMPIMLHR